MTISVCKPPTEEMVEIAIVEVDVDSNEDRRSISTLIANWSEVTNAQYLRLKEYDRYLASRLGVNYPNELMIIRRHDTPTTRPIQNILSIVDNLAVEMEQAQQAEAKRRLKQEAEIRKKKEASAAARSLKAAAAQASSEEKLLDELLQKRGLTAIKTGVNKAEG